MNSILTEISKLRKREPFTIDYKNSNRYRVVAINPNVTKSAYYFSVPIYNNKPLKSIDLKFYSDRGCTYPPCWFYSIGVICSLHFTTWTKLVKDRGLFWGYYYSSQEKFFNQERSCPG